MWKKELRRHNLTTIQFITSMLTLEYGLCTHGFNLQCIGPLCLFQRILVGFFHALRDSTRHFVHWSVGQLLGLLVVRWLVGWSVSGLVGWSVGWLVGWSVYQSVGQPVGHIDFVEACYVTL